MAVYVDVFVAVAVAVALTLAVAVTVGFIGFGATIHTRQEAEWSPIFRILHITNHKMVEK